MLLYVTDAGEEQKAQARLTGTPLPRFAYIEVDDTESQIDVRNPIVPAINAWYQNDGQQNKIVIKQLTGNSFSIRGSIPPDVVGNVRGISLKTTDGVRYAYGRFNESRGGLYKPSGLNLRFDLALIETGRDKVEFTYTPVDVSTLVREILDAAKTQQNTSFYPVTKPTITGPLAITTNPTGTLTAGGSHSCFESDADVQIATYVWALPDTLTLAGSHTFEGATLTLANLIGLATGSYLLRCKARDTLGYESDWQDATLTVSTAPPIATNDPPSTPTLMIDLPTDVERGKTYTIQLAATDANGDAVSFTISDTVGCTFSKSSNITGSVDLTVNAQTDTLAVKVWAVDSKGAKSVNALTITRDSNHIKQPTGVSTGWLDPGTHEIDVPDWADSVDLTGNGGVGVTVACGNDVYGQPDTFISSELLAQSTPAGWLEEAGTSVWVVPYDDGYSNHLFGVLEYNGGKPPPGCYRNSSSVGDYRFFKLINAAKAGDPTTVTGLVTATFAGSAAGSTTAPAQSTQTKTLPIGTGRKLTVTIPATGSLKIDWG